jgi:hypothetical protein
MSYDWDYYSKLKSVFAGSASVSDLISYHKNNLFQIQNGKSMLRFITNHDESAWSNSPLTTFGNIDGSFAAYLLCMTMGGTPLIYSSQELAYPNKLPFFTRTALNWTINPGYRNEMKGLAQFKKNHPALKTADIIDFSNAHVAAFVKQTIGDTVLVVVNTSNGLESLQLPPQLVGNWMSYENGSQSLSSSLSLVGYQYGIYHK